jgi:hypothetical protein
MSEMQQLIDEGLRIEIELQKEQLKQSQMRNRAMEITIAKQ